MTIILDYKSVHLCPACGQRLTLCWPSNMLVCGNAACGQEPLWLLLPEDS